MTTKVEKKDIVVTTEGMYTLSKNKNIVVFILDTFDAQYMNEIIQKDTQFVQQFDGFIYYDNTVGMYPTTKGALPHLLTGIKYLNETKYDEYLDNAFRKTNFYTVLKRNNYVAGVYTSPTAFNKQIPDIIQNIIERAHITIKNPARFSNELYHLTATKYFPHVLKRTIWVYSSEIDNYKNVETVKTPLYRSDDIYFNQRLLEDGLDLLADNNIFRFYHLNGAHPPYTYNDKVETVPREQESSAYNQSKGALQIVLNYIAQLKKLNVYDNSLILVMADHGALDYRNKPLLMIKDRNSIDDFSISSIPVTYENIIPMLESNLNKNMSCTDFLRDGTQENNMYYYYLWEERQWATQAYLPPIREYVFSAEKNGHLYMKSTGRSFFPNNITEILGYNLGDTIVFGEGGNDDDYIVTGFTGKGGGGRYSLGTYGEMRIRLSEKPSSDIIARVTGGLLRATETVRIYVNGTFLEEKTLTGGDWSFVAPRELIPERGLDLSFEYVDPTSPFELGRSADKRIMAVSYKTMTLSENKP
jgi:hypothetical protein